MQLELIQEGFVSRRQPDEVRPVAVGPRAVVTREDEVICSYMTQSALGVNDFVPMQARSVDHGASWHDEGPIWPELVTTQSVFGSVSRSAAGTLFLYGAACPIDRPGEMFWSEETQGLKQNGLFWSLSQDCGKSWTDPCAIALPTPGAAEAPGPLCVTRDGRWVACYAPYRTFDTELAVDRGQVVCVFSDDEGRTWRHSSMHRFVEQDSGGAEAWVIELAGGRLLGTSWHVDDSNQKEYPNAWALSLDHGETWPATGSTGILGQSTALAALPDGSAWFVYNQRRHGEVGVWMAQVHPTATSFGVLNNQVVWRAKTATQTDSTGDHAGWQDFSFGEPAVTVLPDGSFLVVFWCMQPDGQGVRYVKLKPEL